MRTILGLMLGAVLAILGGCGPSVPDSELGTIVNEVPKIEETEEPYELPHVPAPPNVDQKAAKTPHKL